MMKLLAFTPTSTLKFLSEYNMLYLWKAFVKLLKIATLKQTNLVIHLIHLKTNSRIDAQ